ncbi:MAG: cation:proton antiporter [Acidimicrobiia bacterium]|nr:cation:proton antiporter [Acidimicrobiia bacterium]
MSGLILVLAVILAYGLWSRWLSSTPITGPMVFAAAGLLFGPAVLDIVEIPLRSEGIQVLLEGTLVIVLFTDAAVIDVNAARKHLAMPTRLLSVGLLLTIATGTFLAELFFGELGFWGAAVVAVTLAPTDAALGQAVVTNRAVPVTIRQGLSVESGLNDGIVVPLLAVAIAGVAGEIEGMGSLLVVFAQEVGVAAVIGIAVGFIGAKLVLLADQHGWMMTSWRQLAVPTLAVFSYGVADVLHGSGFIAAFVGGLVFGPLVRNRIPDICSFSESIAHLLTVLSFFVFGFAILGPELSNVSVEVVVYALASLTVVRMVPVAISLIGTRLSGWTVGFVGWFGPRGLASLVFAGTVVAELDPVATELTVTIIATTVALSVLLHGLTAWPLSHAYGKWAATMADDDAEMRKEAPVRVRLRIPND